MQIEYVIVDDKRFGVVNEVNHEGTIYVFLANLDDPTDVMIKKYTEQNQDELLPLETDAEFDFALSLFNE